MATSRYILSELILLDTIGPEADKVIRLVGLKRIKQLAAVKVRFLERKPFDGEELHLV